MGKHVAERLAFRVAKTVCDHSPMTAYEPDPTDTKLFARHKQARDTIRTTRKPLREASIRALRDGATNQELAALTGLTPEHFRKLAEEIGVDNRQKPPTVGREAEAAKARTAGTRATEPVTNLDMRSA